jgi:protein Mpv17
VPLAHQLLAVNFMTLLDAAFMSWARTQDDWASQVFGPLGHGGHGAGASAVAEAVGAAGGKKDS